MQLAGSQDGVWVYTKRDPGIQNGNRALQELGRLENPVENSKATTMRLRSLFSCTLAYCFVLVTTQCVTRSGSAGSTSSEIPHLRKQGTATQLIVDGKPFLVLAGELSNNGATSREYMKPVWSKLVEAKLNTVLAGVSWAQIEPQEGKFDFSVLDGVIQDAGSHNLRLVLLWFATWKNGSSSYPPDWLKKDFERFPRAQIAGGRSIELLSPFSDANRDADARAFAALMRHIKAVDGQQHTVIMIQVENEVGMRGDTRDRSPVANQAYQGPVPKELMDYLQQHKETLIPEFRQVWEAAGSKTAGSWEQVFGKSAATDQIFMGLNFARYVRRVAEAGKAEYPLPMYMNAYTYGFQPVRASGSPMPDLMDVWRAGAPRIDIFSPDNATNFVVMCAKYTQSGNPLFIPEEAPGPEGAARSLYAFGRHDAIGYSRMSGGVDRLETPDEDLIGSYDLITQLAPLILEHQGDGTMSAVVLGPNDPPQKVRVGNYTLEAAFLGSHNVGPSALPPEPPPRAAAILIATGPDEYFAAGNGLTVTFSPTTPGPPLAGLATVEEGTFVNGHWVPSRRLAGDDTIEGDCVQLRWPLGSKVPLWAQRRSTEGIQRVTLYRYR